MQVNSTRACSTYSAETTPPSHCGVLPSGKNCTTKISCKKNKAEFSYTPWPRVYVTTGALSPTMVETTSHCSSSGSAMDTTLQWQSQ